MNIFDYYFMKKAIKQAEIAYQMNEVPIGCVIVKNNEIIATGFNKKEKTKKGIMHAEIDAILKASKIIGDWRLYNTTLYVTCEPCVMCAGAIIHHRVKKVVFGIKEPKFGGVVSNIRVFDIPFNHKVKYSFGLLEKEISALLKSFFDKKRKK